VRGSDHSLLSAIDKTKTQESFYNRKRSREFLVELHKLSETQQSIWNMEQYYGGSIANITGSLLFNDAVEPQALQAALNRAIDQCDSIRIRLETLDGLPMQYISPFITREFETVRFAERAEFDAWANTAARTPFDSGGELFQIYIVVIGEQTGFIIKLHHLTADAWALNIFGGAVLRNLYRGGEDIRPVRSVTFAPKQERNLYGNGEDIKPGSFLDHLKAEREYNVSSRREDDRRWFLSLFESCREPVYLCDRLAKNPAADRLTFTIGENDSARLKDFCADNGASPFQLFMNALAIYIHRVKGAKDFYIGTTVHNRTGKKEKETVGVFINTAPVLLHVDEESNALENLRQTGKDIFGVLRHQKYQYGELLKAVRERYDFSDRFFDVMLKRNQDNACKEFTPIYDPAFLYKNGKLSYNASRQSGSKKISPAGFHSYPYRSRIRRACHGNGKGFDPAYAKGFEYSGYRA